MVGLEIEPELPCQDPSYGPPSLVCADEATGDHSRNQSILYLATPWAAHPRTYTSR